MLAQVAELLAAPELGTRPGAVVLDVLADEVLLERDAARARTPASLAKLAVCAAALLTLGADTRLQTRVVTGSKPFEVVLVGGGDSTLALRRTRPGAYPPRASLAELAVATAAQLRSRGGRVPVTVSIDDAVFTGPAVSPSWEPSYVRSGVVAPVHALMANGGRTRPRSDLRVRDPALAAGRQFARLLAREGIEVSGAVGRTSAAPDADVLAAVASAPVATLVEIVLTASDNDLAESLARLVARATGRPASFDGVTAALPQVLARAGLETDGLRLLDGSGLARASGMSPRLVARLLALSTKDARLRPVVTGLPVAAFSGTLADRFDFRAAGPAAGLVRAKTATLTGVAGLAGVATTHSGSYVVFAVLADGVAASDALRARRVLDRAAALLSVPG